MDTTDQGSARPRPGDTLRDLAVRRLDRLDRSISGLVPPTKTVILMEAARVLDQFHMADINPKTDPERHAVDFNLACRGWNVLLGRLLARQEPGVGMPMMTSTPDSRARVLRLLREFGEHALLVKVADMVDADFCCLAEEGPTIEIVSTGRANDDLYTDQLETGRMRKALGPEPDPLAGWRLEHDELDDLLASLVRPSPTPWGQMVAYDAHPALDAHFLAIATLDADAQRSEAGVHPDTDFGRFTGADLSFVLTALTSFRLKHIALVDRAKKMWPETNFSMSLTIWGPAAGLLESLQDLAGAGIAPDRIAAVMEALVYRPGDAGLLGPTDTPYFPLLVQMHGDYLLLPVAGALHNAYSAARTFLERRDPNLADRLRIHREQWMLDELNFLFQGSRYQRLARPLLLRRGKQIVTDIDGAVLDNLTGELGLFQLKWQDFETSDVRKHRSKAVNFTREVESWSGRVGAWIAEHGGVALLDRLGFRSPGGAPPRSVYLFAIGRSAARFRSLAGRTPGPDVATAAWPQLIRLRHELDLTERPISDLHALARVEAGIPPRRKPVPVTLEVEGVTLTFRDLWNAVGDEDEDEAAATGADGAPPA